MKIILFFLIKNTRGENNQYPQKPPAKKIRVESMIYFQLIIAYILVEYLVPGT